MGEEKRENLLYRLDYQKYKEQKPNNKKTKKQKSNQQKSNQQRTTNEEQPIKAEQQKKSPIKN